MREAALGLLLTLGVLFSLWLQTAIRGEVFFSGDGGVKALMTRQLAEGPRRPDLVLDAEPWLRELWDQGLFPLGSPFVYRIEGRRYVQYPLVFPALSAPFYAAFGYRGLYVLPLLGTWITWAAFAVLCRRLELGAAASALGLAGLVFASHLTPYAAIFWEHAPAVGLSFAGFALAFSPQPVRRSHRRELGAGLLMGAAILLRPESGCFLGVALLGVAALEGSARRAMRVALPAGALLAAFLASNLAIYGQPLGLHGVQVEEAGARHTPHMPAAAILLQLGEEMLRRHPVLPLVAALALAGLSWRTLRPERRVLVLGGMIAAFYGLTGLVVPSHGGMQIGARYLLPAVPLLWLLVALQLDGIRRRAPRWVYRGAAVAFAALVAWGVHLNARADVEVLFRNYGERILPALRHVRASELEAVAVAHQYIAQELAAAFPEKSFVRVRSREGLRRLVRALRARGEDAFLWVELRPRRIAPARLGELEVVFRRQGRKGRYSFHRALIRSRR